MLRPDQEIREIALEKALQYTSPSDPDKVVEVAQQFEDFIAGHKRVTTISEGKTPTE